MRIDIRNVQLLVLLFGVTLACGPDDPSVQQNGFVSFGLNHVSSAGGRVKGSDDVKFVKYTIKSQSDELIMGEKELIVFGSSFTTDPIMLEIGVYTLEEFLVLNEEHQVILASPKEGSEFADLVVDPLPISFTVNNDTIHVVPEVISIEEDMTAEEFGYASFGFKEVEVKPIAIKITRVTNGDLMIPEFDCTFSVQGKNESGEVVWSKSWDLSAASAIEKSIYVPIGFYRYSFSATKDDYMPHNIYVMGSDIPYTNDLAFELMTENSTDVFSVELMDWVIEDRKIGTLYFAYDKCKSYCRFDMEEEFIDDDYYFWVDKDATDETGLPLSLINISECYSDKSGCGEDSYPCTPVFCGNTVNMFGNKPFAEADDYCSSVDMSKSPIVQTLDDVYSSSYFFIIVTEGEAEDILAGHMQKWGTNISGGRKSKTYQNLDNPQREKICKIREDVNRQNVIN